MAQVGIYLLAHQDEDPILTVCKLCGQYASIGRKVYGYTTQADVAHRLDDQLWTFKDNSFIPHEIFSGEELEQPLPQVLIGPHPSPATHRDVLINLSYEIPAWYSDFPRIVEVVPKGTEARNACRSRYKAYKAAGHEVKTFEQDPGSKSGWTLRT